MPLANYFELFWRQVFVTVPNGFGGEMKVMRDGSQIWGLFITPPQSEVREAEAQRIAGQQTFMTGMEHLIAIGDVIRREEGDTYHRAFGLPELAPGPAVSKIQLVPTELLTGNQTGGY